jgi:imidazole glycerol-phosphate synthase subunit HisF
MLRPRIIPCLLVHDKGLVKTVKFKSPKYVGDPINAVRIFNEKQVDELTVLDIDATIENSEPNYKMIKNLATECRMPLCYGGGVKTADQAQRIFSLGVEKIAISSSAIKNPNLVIDIAKRVGSQSVVVIIDVKKKTFGGYEAFTNNGKKATGINPIKFAKELQLLGAGELVINFIDNDGMMEGYNYNYVEKIREVTTLPLTILGGAGSLKHIGKLINKFGIIGASAGSLFVFKGIYKAVLINYPSQKEKENLIKENFKFL